MKSLSIHLTNQCNNSCQFCVVNSHIESKEKVNKKIIYKYLKDNADKGYESINIHGGEPTIIPEFLDVLRWIKEYNYPSISLQTNARLLSNIDFAQKVVDGGVDLFVVSIHGKNAEEHDAITTVHGSFDEAVAGIKNVLALNKKVRTNTVVSKLNMNSLCEIVEFITELGVQHINISALHPAGKAFENFFKVTPTHTESIENVKAAVDILKAKNIIVALEGFPYCILDDYVKYMINWDEKKFKLLFRKTVLEDYADFMTQQTCKYIKKCRSCSNAEKCGGIYKEYLMYYGSKEFDDSLDDNVCG